MSSANEEKPQTDKSCILCNSNQDEPKQIDNLQATHSGNDFPTVFNQITHLFIAQTNACICHECFEMFELYDFFHSECLRLQGQIMELVRNKRHLFVGHSMQRKFYNDRIKKRRKSSAGGKHFTCNTCLKVFKTLRLYNQHIKTHDEDDTKRNIISAESSNSKLNENLIVKRDCENDKATIGQKIVPEPFEAYDDGNTSELPLSKAETTYDDVDVKEDPDEEKDPKKIVNPRRRRRGRPKTSDGIRIAVNRKPRTVPCPECPKKWRSQHALRIHMRTHDPSRAHVCDICGQVYKNKVALSVHIGMHNGESPYKCDVCGKIFTQSGALGRHMPIHTGVANYQCDLCGKRFIHYTSFKMHQLVHTGKKAFKCPTCGLALMSTSHLTRHMRIHTGEKRFACSTCDKKFAERYNLLSHERTHFAKWDASKRRREYKCQWCGVRFARGTLLVAHMESHRGIDADTSDVVCESIVDEGVSSLDESERDNDRKSIVKIVSNDSN